MTKRWKIGVGYWLLFTMDLTWWALSISTYPGTLLNVGVGPFHLELFAHARR